MKSEADTLLKEYQEYANLFSCQIFTKEVYAELSGEEELDIEYPRYVSSCYNRMFSFRDWYEHSYSRPLPESLRGMSDVKFMQYCEI